MSVVINRSEASSLGSGGNRKPSPPKVKPRTYNDEPLPIQASDYAPRSATIVNRVFEGGVVTFELKIGETVLPDVGLDEVLDYVSPHHLEEFENRAFQQEEELLRIAEEDDRRFKEEQDERRRERQRNKGVLVTQDTSSDGMEDGTEEDVNTGKHGRARPSYKPLFKQLKQRRRRRKRDPRTGELLPLSDDDEVGVEQEDMGVEQDSSSEDRFESKPEADPGPDPLSLDNLPRRRRRKRDPVTNELLPLEPIEPAVSRQATVDGSVQQFVPESLEKAKRPRRRRHPVTNELMPLGWRYNPEEETRQNQNGIKVPSMQRLSISNESEPKRRRLDQTMFSDERSASPRLRTQSSNRGQGAAAAPLSAFKQGNVIDLMGSDSDESADDSIDVRPAAPKPKLLRRGVGGASIAQKAKSQTPSDSPGPSNLGSLPVRVSPRKPGPARMPSASSTSSIIPLQVDEAASSSAEESESDEEDITLPPTKPVTSIMHPSAATQNATSSSEEESSSEDEDLPDDEYFVEEILRHALSNPLTHPDHLGKQPVMLYEVKWAGFKDTTWEPETSFGSLDVVREYQKKVGMK